LTEGAPTANFGMRELLQTVHHSRGGLIRDGPSGEPPDGMVSATDPV